MNRLGWLTGMWASGDFKGAWKCSRLYVAAQVLRVRTAILRLRIRRIGRKSATATSEPPSQDVSQFVQEQTRKFTDMMEREAWNMLTGGVPPDPPRDLTRDHLMLMRNRITGLAYPCPQCGSPTLSVASGGRICSKWIEGCEGKIWASQEQ